MARPILLMAFGQQAERLRVTKMFYEVLTRALKTWDLMSLFNNSILTRTP